MFNRFVLALLFILLHGQGLAASESLLLNGPEERIIVDHDPALQPPDGITIEAWIRPNSLSGCQTIVGKNFRTGYWLGICSGLIRMYTNGLGSEVLSSDGVPATTWSHVAGTFDGTTLRYFINGEQILSQSRPGPIGVNTDPMGIGGEAISPTFPSNLFAFDGYLSEVRLWSYARSREQIRDTMYQQLWDQVRAGLIGNWPLSGFGSDSFGRFTSTPAAGVEFSGLDAPPILHRPVQVYSAAVPVPMDGTCGIEYFANAAVPSWYLPSDLGPGERNPQIIRMTHDASSLYICLPNRAFQPSSIFSVILRTDISGGGLRDSDYRFQFWPDETGLTTLRGSPGGGIFDPTWQPASNPAGLNALITGEFATDVEFQIPLSLVTDPRDLAQIQVSHSYLDGGGTSEIITTWPPQAEFRDPQTWQQIKINPGNLASFDRMPPELTLTMPTETPAEGSPAEFTVNATDDSDLELVELLVDDVVVASQALSGSSNLTYTLNHQETFPVGVHRAQARAFDSNGREGRSRFITFRVVLDGELPRVTLSFSPSNPGPGQTVTLTALAADPSGLTSVIVREVFGVTSPGFRRCDVAPISSTASCSFTVTPPARTRHLRFEALAEDVEGLTGEASRVVLFGNTGPDQDEDGLADALENELCTSPTDPDTDRDGLSDSWEILGIEFANGSVEPLPDYGANPCRKNIFLQMDYEQGTAAPFAGLNNLRNQLRQRDISLYTEVNERPRPTAYSQTHFSADNANYFQDGSGDYYLDPQRIWAFQYGYQRHRSGRSGANHRFFNVDYYFVGTGFCSGGSNDGEECTGAFNCPGGGQCVRGCEDGSRKGLSCTDSSDCPLDDEGNLAACGVPCDAAAVASPGRNRCAARSTDDLSFRLMHEFGHSVGLGHGGSAGPRDVSINRGFVTNNNVFVNTNYKPNQISVMNYGYNRGLLCMQPVPSPLPDGYQPELNSVITFLDEDLGSLDETSLDERSTSPFASRLRLQSCAHTTGSAFPVVRYRCENAGTRYEVLSDGTRTVARRAEGGDWDFSPPVIATGIDWNCDNVISTGSTVSENIQQTWDDNVLLTLDAFNEYDRIPNPHACHDMYIVACGDTPRGCYLWPDEYRNAIPNLATGLAPVDCRANFLALKSTDARCRDIPDEAFGTETCTIYELDTPIAGKMQLASSADKGDANIPNPFQQIAEQDPNDPPPGVELCDLDDNDGDGVVDEYCADGDLDGVVDLMDNCPTVDNVDQTDRDADGLGDACQHPKVTGLVGNWDGGNTVSIDWQPSTIPVAGYVVYRYSETDPAVRYLGDSYPTTVNTRFVDTLSFGGEISYVVRAVNLNGEEGEAVVVTVGVDISEFIFGDSFE